MTHFDNFWHYGPYKITIYTQWLLNIISIRMCTNRSRENFIQILNVSLTTYTYITNSSPILNYFSFTFCPLIICLNISLITLKIHLMFPGFISFYPTPSKDDSWLNRRLVVWIFLLCRIWWQNRSFSFPLIHFPLLIYRLYVYIFFTTEPRI